MTETNNGGYPLERIRGEFPILQTMVRGKPLVYLDNAATTQKPRVVIDATERYYVEQNANIHRGVHYLSELATSLYEGSRERVRQFINAADSGEIIWTRGTTEGINLVAQSWGRTFLKEGDEIVISYMEHHSNIVPWQILCEQIGTVLRVVPIDDDGNLLMDEYERALNERTKLVAMAHISNALGTINPVLRITELAHAAGAKVLIDGAQAVAHAPVDVQALDCDFYAFSGHKLYGPTGIGVLYGKRELLEAMPPWQGGGDMISSVSFEGTSYNQLPWKFEAGTPNIAGGVVLGTAVDYVSDIGLEAIAAHEQDVLQYATEVIAAIPGVRIVGNAKEKSGIVSFTVEGVHPHDVGQILDFNGVAIRAGHHCAQPCLARLGVGSTARASFAMHSTKEEVDVLARAIDEVKEAFT
jgi:cysteine desulfurase / selenocysteine lyase